ncbi:hypothetical protein ASPVEDRAFT_185906 [Aspergillus versicolor CBS 583.65]|uniref:Uncharacterized protein n=1 Tax=Aspergillus versicolor CBS 583.65 TaxID=1036611 RepID=A0A1L9PAB4_ASPVE|nr:uncharacterized protein ASPVEDRAFT_185906 [Aspergillus versicolor CBS 583.65]OJI98451.1 hypothetical protein ASPVEDRAFT_185906 [Aspergillus versicolor CBS 583.65]
MYRPSLSQQTPGPATLARFQLAKFSYATTSINHRGPITWSHVFGNGDIIGIFEKYVILSSKKVLFRVRNNQETLEQVAITDLMRDFEDHARSAKDNPKPGFAVVVKLPCLAVKYPQSPGFVRRFQIKFSSDRDFYSALSILSEINCPFSESNVGSVRPMSRPVSSLSTFGHINTGLGLQSDRSAITRAPTSDASIFPSYRPASSSSGILTPYIYTAVPTSSSSSTALGSTSRAFSTLSSSHGSPFDDTFSAGDVPQASLHPEQGESKPPSTSTGHDLDLPPKRLLPFPTSAAKRGSRAAKAKEATPQNRKNKATSTNTTSPPPPSSLTTIASPRNQATIPTHETPVANNAPFLPTQGDLANYISNPTKERTAALENWICGHLEDDNFLQLCIDVEGVWTRFAVGK